MKVKKRYEVLFQQQQNVNDLWIDSTVLCLIQKQARLIYSLLFVWVCWRGGDFIWTEESMLYFILFFKSMEHLKLLQRAISQQSNYVLQSVSIVSGTLPDNVHNT